MSVRKIKNNYLRRTILVCGWLPVGCVACILICLGVAAREFYLMCRDTPEEFMGVWNGEEKP